MKTGEPVEEEQRTCEGILYLRKFYCIYLIKQENNYQILSPHFLHVSVLLADIRHDRFHISGGHVVAHEISFREIFRTS